MALALGLGTSICKLSNCMLKTCMLLAGSMSIGDPSKAIRVGVWIYIKRD